MMYDVLEALTVNIPLKIFVCFLLSAFVLVGMAFYFYENIIYEPAEVSMLVAVFLTLFLFFFFCFNMRQAPADKLKVPARVDEEKEPVIQDYIPEIPSLNDQESVELAELEDMEELETVEDLAEQKTVFVDPRHVSNIRLAFGDDDIPYLVESSGLELVDGDLGEIVRFIRGAEPAEPEELAEIEPEELEVVFPFVSIVAVDDAAPSDDGVEAVELEDISTSFGSITIFRQPFAYSLSNPELLHGAASQVIYEQNGIHYINTSFDAEGTDKVLDSNFAKLVESVLASAPGD
jgi:hypothetical protein